LFFEDSDEEEEEEDANDEEEESRDILTSKYPNCTSFPDISVE
jgi:hypothetical protein